MLVENIKMALKTLSSNKMRSFLTMLGIIIGIASVIAILTVGNSLTKSVSENMQSIGANDVYISVVKRSDNNKVDSADAVDGIAFKNDNTRDMKDSDYISPEMIHDLISKFKDEIYAVNIQNNVGRGRVEKDRNSESVSLSGVSAGYFVTNQIEIVAGNFFSQSDFDNMHRTALINENLAKDLFGDDYKSCIGQEIDIKLEKSSEKFNVSGVYKNVSKTSGGASMPMMSLLGSAVYIPLKTSYKAFHNTEQFSYIQLVTSVGTDSAKLSKDVETFFESYYRNNADYRVMSLTLEGMLDMLTTLLDTITLAISIIAGIALLVGGIGVMNIMLVSVTERTREIGTRKALGARNTDIRAQFISEAMIICLIGGIIGVILGIALGVVFSNLLNYPARPSISGIIIAILFSMSIGVFFGYFPADKAARMNPIDALRYE